MNNGKHPELYLVDGSGFIFRAFHALPPLTRPDGTPVGAVLGFVNMLQKLLGEFHAAQLAVIFDAKRKNFRNDIYPEYKANRTAPPEELIPQFPLIREATIAFDLPALELEGYEADDLIAAYARCAVERGQHVTIVSSDKDLMQLVRDGVDMLDPLKYRRIGREDVIEKFGVPPEKVVDVQALAGDSTDNVPGVPGIGVKTAAQLITEYGDLETLLARAHEIKQPKRRELLTQYAEQARISKQLVRLDDQAPVPKALDELKVHEPNPATLIPFLEEQGFRSVVARVKGKAFSKPALEKPAIQDHNLPALAPQALLPAPGDVTVQYASVQSLDELQGWIQEACKKGMLAIDTETNSLVASQTGLVGISLATEAGRACYIPLQHGKLAEAGLLDQVPPQQIPLKDAIAALKPLLEDKSILKVGHNIKFDYQVLAQHGIRMNPVDDTMVMSYVLDGTSHRHGFDELCQLLFQHETITYNSVVGTGKKQLTFDQIALDKAVPYAAEDADYTLRFYDYFKPRIGLEKMAGLYEDFERPLVKIIACMEEKGIMVDTDMLRALGQEFSIRAAEMEKEIFKISGRNFNIGSPLQMGKVLFEDMKLPGGVKSKTGAYSTAVDVLEQLSAQGHVIADKILAWRQVTKLRSTYCEGLLSAVAQLRDQRVHTSYMMTVTNTGRLSSTDPNLQNIPIRTEAGRKIRSAFIAAPGHVLLSADYSQIELRLVAALANVPALKEAFQNGVDIHAKTASEVFHVPLDAVTPDQRRNAKTINFGIIYGISAWGLSQQLGSTPALAGQYINQYFARFPELKDYMERAREEARRNGFVTTFYGRKCFIDGANDKNPARRAAAERQAINAPFQGTASDIVKRAMIRVDHTLKEAGNPSFLLLQVHDELVLEVPENLIEETMSLVKEAMESAAPELDVPLDVEIHYGRTWK